MIVPLKCPILVFFPAKAMFDDTIGQVDQENTSFVLTRLNISDISEPHPPDLPSLGGNVGKSATWTSQGLTGAGGSGIGMYRVVGGRMGLICLICISFLIQTFVDELDFAVRSATAQIPQSDRLQLVFRR